MEKQYKKRGVELLLALTVVVTGFLVWIFYNRQPQTGEKLSEVVVKAETSEEVGIKTIEVISPDEKYTLSMTNEMQEGEMVHQVFKITKNDDQSLVLVLDETRPQNSQFVIPFNTFSPTNKYIFLKIDNQEGPEYVVLRADGTELKPGLPYQEIISLFSEKYPDYRVTDVTGWGGYTQIVVNTDTLDGQTGPSWWFNANNFTFYKLSTRFN